MLHIFLALDRLICRLVNFEMYEAVDSIVLRVTIGHFILVLTGRYYHSRTHHYYLVVFPPEGTMCE